MQLFPLRPQLVIEGGETQSWLDVQQPPLHEVPSQTQLLPRQRWPTAHGTSVPHLHFPLLQSLEKTGSHEVQLSPPRPQAETPGGVVQTPPSEQQPPGHELPLQTQAPPTQFWPGAQAAAVPQVHWPAVHWSAVDPLHLEQAPPGALPQVGYVGGKQTSPLQQPERQDVLSHWHEPATQRCPGAHRAPVVPHAQAPFEQRSAVGGQAAHAIPGAPQEETDLAVQRAPEQHPPGHDVGLQTQVFP